MRMRSGGGKEQAAEQPSSVPRPPQGEAQPQAGPSSCTRDSIRLTKEAEQQLQAASAQPRQRGQAGPRRVPKLRHPAHAQATQPQAPPPASPGEDSPEPQGPLALLPGDVLDHIMLLLAAGKRGSCVRATCRWLRSAFDRCNTRLVLWGTAGQFPPSFPARLLHLVRHSPRVNSLTLGYGPKCPTWPQVLEAGGPQLLQRLERLAWHLFPGPSQEDLAPCTRLQHLCLCSGWEPGATPTQQLQLLAACGGTLRRLDVYCGRDRDLSPLAACVQLQQLSVSSGFILQDISPLAACTQLQSLTLSNCYQLTDLSPLAALGAVLQELGLTYAYQLTNLAPLASCTALHHLDLASCSAVQDLGPLAACTGLQGLSLQHCAKVSNLAPLAACTALQRLDLRECSMLEDLGPLAACRSLKSLDLMSCSGVQSLQPLASCLALESLDLRGCPAPSSSIRAALPHLCIIED